MECLHKMVMQSDDMREPEQKYRSSSILMSAPDVPSWQYRSDNDRQWHFKSFKKSIRKKGMLCKSASRPLLLTVTWSTKTVEATPTFDSKSEEMNNFGDLEKTLKSNQGVKGLKILSFDRES